MKTLLNSRIGREPKDRVSKNKADRRHRRLHHSASAPLIVKVANAEDEATGNAYELYEFAKPRNRRGVERQPREKAFDENALRQFLIQKNCRIPRSVEKAEALIRAATRRRPKE